jgi:hypothetical protein
MKAKEEYYLNNGHEHMDLVVTYNFIQICYVIINLGTQPCSMFYFIHEIVGCRPKGDCFFILVILVVLNIELKPK